jgi:tetratricopeptide (TPR) repeat protein
MGVVYRARDRATGREVALKVVLETRLHGTRLERFRREGQITASLHHPGIVRVHAAGEVQGLPYLAYELVEGARVLDRVLASTPSLADRVGLVRDASRALGHAHTQGVVHRDVKPDNVLVDIEGRVRVADFGLATAHDLDRLTRTGAVLGTPHYMAPELMAGDRDQVGPATDVWSLGVILFQALTGQLPFQGETLMELASQVSHAAPPRPRSLSPEVPPALESVCLQALRRDPAQRYPDGEALAADLERAVRGEAVTARATSWVTAALRHARWAVPATLGVAGVVAAVLYQPAPPTLNGSPPATARASAPKPAPAPEPEPAEPAGPEPAEPAEPEPEPAVMVGDVLTYLGENMEYGDARSESDFHLQRGRQLRSERRFEEALEAFRHSAGLGGDRAMVQLAEAYRDGRGVEPDRDQATAWYRQAAEAGNEDAMVALVRRGLRAGDRDQAHRWFLALLAAQQEDQVQVLARAAYLEDPELGRAWAQDAREAGVEIVLE